MGGIRLLPPEVARGIAAGEVIERPASALKELLENAIDAGAADIDVSLEAGGRSVVRVRDDGAGIEPEDLPLSIAPHATSKIRCLGDLEELRSLGFRGEALASLARVSDLRIASRPRDRDAGAEIHVRWGDVQAVAPATVAPGTIVEVRDLFERLPARRKFLRSPATEFARCEEAFLQAACAWPDVTFRLRHGDRIARSLPGGDGFSERARSLLGLAGPDRGIPIHATRSGMTLSGLVEAGRARAGSPARWFVNGRPVRDRTLQRALRQATEGLVPHGRGLAAVLRLEVPPPDLDVNVHPAKTEVRFRDSRAVFLFLLDALRRALRSEGHGPRPFPLAAAPLPPAAEPVAEPDLTGSPPLAAVPALLFRAAEPDGAARPVLQVHRTYLVQETADGVAIADQHALHERILLEKLHAEWEDGIPSQRLVSPLAVPVPPEGRARLLEAAADLRRAGFDLSPLGDDALLLRSIPSFLTLRDPIGFLQDLAVDVCGERAPAPGDSHFLLERIACRAALKAGAHLAPEEAARLLARHRDLPNACAHGRPVTLEISLRELERRFGRA